jgi:hypothetical protein
MMPGIKTIWVLTGMTLKIVDKPLTLAMKIMVLTNLILNENTYFRLLRISKKR